MCDCFCRELTYKREFFLSYKLLKDNRTLPNGTKRKGKDKNVFGWSFIKLIYEFLYSYSMGFAWHS